MKYYKVELELPMKINAKGFRLTPGASDPDEELDLLYF